MGEGEDLLSRPRVAMSSTKEGNAVIACREGGGGRGRGASGDVGGVMGLVLLNEWASSSVGRHSERWIVLESDGMIRDMVGKTTPGLPLPLDSFRRSSLSLSLPSIMNQQQPAASSQPGVSLYMGQRLEMEYLCAGAHRSRILLRTIANLSSQQIVARKTRSDPVNRSAVENADTESCTRNAPRGVSVFFVFLSTVADPPSHWFPETGSGPI